MIDPMFAAAAADVATTAAGAVKATGMGGLIHVGLAGLGSAIGVGLIGMKAAEATGRNPGAAGAIRNQAILFAALAEAIIFFAIFLVK
jgi:F-type H+-transporting ATPase subunit c